MYRNIRVEGPVSRRYHKISSNYLIVRFVARNHPSTNAISCITVTGYWEYSENGIRNKTSF